jgi:hypothetical protein
VGYGKMFCRANEDMKRSGFQQKPRKPLKRTPLKARTPLQRGKNATGRKKLRKRSPASISLIQRKIWAKLREKLIAKYGSDCYTCNAKDLEGSNRQLGHMWAKASVGAYLKYDERILRIQCYRCNINLGGNGAVFYARMLKEIGAEKMKQLEEDRNVTVKARDHYEQLLKELEA